MGKFRLILFFLGVPLKCCVLRCISLREDAAATAHALSGKTFKVLMIERMG